MWDRLPMRGTILNAVLVALGAVVGLAAGSVIPANLKEIVIPAIGLCNIAFSIRMFFKGNNVLITVACIVLGAIIGSLMGLDQMILSLAEWAKQRVGGTGTFNEGLITTSVLYCVGPMTLLGCIKDGLEKDIELLKIKSTLDGISAVFFAATLGSGVLVTALVVLIFQGALTLAARPLEPLTKIEGAIEEMSAVGGVMMLGIGFGLTGIKKFPVEIFMPALALAPVWVILQQKFARTEPAESSA